MPKLTDAQLAKAAKMFLASNPAAAARIFSITQADADFMGTSLEKLRLQRTMDGISKHAYENGLNSMELRFSLASETAEEFHQLLTAHQALINENLRL